MTEQEIKMRIWMLQQDNLHRGDIIERSKSKDHIEVVRKNMKETDIEIARLRKMLRRS